MNSQIKKYILGKDGTLDFTNKRLFFWSGIFSQWHKSNFRHSDRDFNTAEQAMMFKKAMLFNDVDIAEQILSSNNPRKQKELGRLVKGYDDSVWAEKRLDIVAEINYSKFSQNTELLHKIITLVDWEFVEASHEDKIWGIGLSESDPLIYDSSNWQGQNLLGKAIKKAQQKIIENL